MRRRRPPNDDRRESRPLAPPLDGTRIGRRLLVRHAVHRAVRMPMQALRTAAILRTMVLITRRLMARNVVLVLAVELLILRRRLRRKLVRLVRVHGAGDAVRAGVAVVATSSPAARRGWRAREARGGRGAGVAGRGSHGRGGGEQRMGVGLDAVGADARAVVPGQAEPAVRDLGHAAVLAGLALGLQLGDEEANVLRGGGARGVFARLPLLAIPLALLALQLVEAAGVVAVAGFADGLAPLVALGLLLAAGLADGEEGLHFGLALVFELGFRFRELDDRVDAAALAFARDDLLGWAGFGVVGWQGDDGADGEAVINVCVVGSCRGGVGGGGRGGGVGSAGGV